ncbi:MAG TPA: hypothetical protein VMV94_11050, partial [Phycisphaerae bacterium]|nr:hypothetical protein [Phycisphaerae bacterium]
MNRRFGLVAAFAGAVWAAAAGGSFGQTHDATPGGRPGSVGGQPPAQVRAQPPADPRESAPSPEPPPAPLTSQAVPATTEPASQPTTESAEAQDPRLTPRTMMEEFLQAVGESEEKPERIQDAVGCLDLTEMARTNPKVAERRGPVIAKQLDEIIE